MGKMRARREFHCPPPPRPTLYLVFINDSNLRTQTFCSPMSCEGSHSVVRGIPELAGVHMVACCHGWLVLRDHLTWCLWDPVSLQRIELPQLFITLKRRYICTLTAPPDVEAECVILLSNGNTLLFCRLGDKHWTKQVVEFGLHDIIVSNGVVYGLEFEHENLLVIDVDTTSKSVRAKLWDEEVPCPVYYYNMRTMHYLVDSCNEVFMVVMTFPDCPQRDILRVDYVSVLRLDMERWVWIQVKNLNDPAFFLGSNCCMSFSSRELGEAEGNCLYFTLPKDTKVFRYGIEDKSLKAWLPCEKKLWDPWYVPLWVLVRSSQQQQGQRKEKLWDKIENQDSNAQDDHIEVSKVEMEKVQLENGTLRSMFHRLPIDVIELLATHLSIMDYVSFRSVCKEFHAAAPLPLPIERRNHNTLTPLLMLSKNDDPTCNLVDPFQNQVYLMDISPHLVGCSVVFSSKDGLIMGKGDHEHFHFYNPFSGVSLELPSCDNWLDSIIFSSFPTSSTSMTVGICSFQQTIRIFCFDSADQEWTEYSYENGIESKEDGEFYPGYNTPVYHDGCFYFLEQTGYLGVFNPAEEEPTWNILNRPDGVCKSIYSNHLVECDGELLAVFIGRFGNQVQIFRLDQSSK